MTYPAPFTLISVPAHLLGTRAALFHIWRAAGPGPVPAATLAPRPVAQPAGLERMRAAFQADSFVFARTA